MAINSTRIITFFSLFVAFLVSTKLPDGLFTAKELGLYIVAAISILLAFIVFLKKSNRQRFYVLPLDGLVVVYLVVLPAIQLLYFSNIAFSSVLIQIAYGFIYIALRIVTTGIRPTVLVHAVAEVFTIVLCFQLAIAVAQHLGIMPSYYPMFGATGMFFNPGPFAIFTSSLMAFVLIAFCNNLFAKRYGIMLLQGLLLLVGVYFIALSMSRSAWMGLFIGLSTVAAAYMIVRFKSWIHTHRKFVIISGLLCLPLFVLAGAWLYNLKSGSADGRMLVWFSSIGMVKDHWPTGVGLGNFAPTYVNYQAEYFRSSLEGLERFGRFAGDSRYAFNDFLQTFGETGIIGFLLFIAIICLILRSFWCSFQNGFTKKWVVLGSFGLAAALICILVSGLTAYPMQMVPMSLLFWILMALAATLFGSIRIKLPAILQYILTFSLICGATFYGYTAMTTVTAFRGWVKGVKVADSQSAVKDLARWYPILNDRAGYLSLLASHHRKLEDHTKANQYLTEAVSRNPAHVFYYALGRSHEALGDTVSALKSYRLIGDAVPHLLRPRYREAMLFYNSGQIAIFKFKAENAIDFQTKIYNAEVIKMKDELRVLLKEMEL